MGKKIVYHFYLKDKNSLEPTPINFSITVANNRKRRGVGESIQPKWWNSKDECAIESNQQTQRQGQLSKRVNKKVKRIREELDDLLLDYQAVDKLTPNHTAGQDSIATLFEQIDRIIDGEKVQEVKEEKQSKLTPSQYFEQFEKDWKKTTNKRTGSVPGKGTMWNYANTRRRYMDYIKESGRKDSFSIFDKHFIALFDDFLINEQELRMNTIVSTHSQLKTMLRRAYDDKLLQDASFRDWPSKPIEITRLYLDDNELNRIYNLAFTSEVRGNYGIGADNHIEETRDLFIISARTGLRLSDLKHLNNATWKMDVKGKETLIIYAQKTKEKLVIPLHQNVIDIYNKYHGHLPIPIDKSKYNEQVRLCAKIAGITENVEMLDWDKGEKTLINSPKYEHLSSHTGRRSFATNYFKVSHSAQLTMAITGHKTEENFRKYLCLDKEDFAEIARRYINLDDAEVRRYKEQTEVMKRCVKDSGVIAEEERKSLLSMINDMEYAWGLGLSFEEYVVAMRRMDELADEAEDDV